jgi:hypothetical protein
LGDIGVIRAQPRLEDGKGALEVGVGGRLPDRGPTGGLRDGRPVPW